MKPQIELSHLFYQDEHISCLNYKTSLDFGFKYVKLKKGEALKIVMPRHNLIMQISGVTELSCDRYPKRNLTSLQMIMIPRFAHFEATVLEDSDIVIFGFEVPLSNCDKHRLESYAPLCEAMAYEFEPTPIKKSVKLFLDLLTHYIESGINCVHMHESKHKEFFLCLKAFYSKEDIANLLHPVIGCSIDFKNIILQNSDNFKCINDMIDVCNMSRTQFYKTFKDVFGTTAKQWLLKKQIEKIKFAAAKPNISVKELMYELGFEASTQFTQFCKLHCGYTPSELIESFRLGK